MGLCEQLSLDDACPLGEAEKLHLPARDLMVRALLNHEPASRNGLADEFAWRFIGKHNSTLSLCWGFR